MGILAIPQHDVRPQNFSTIEKAAKMFNTTPEMIQECIDKGSAFMTLQGRIWYFDESIGNGERRTFKCVETGEEVSVYGAKEFCEWSGYKSNDILTKGSGRVVNRNDGKTYELVD